MTTPNLPALTPDLIPTPDATSASPLAEASPESLEILLTERLAGVMNKPALEVTDEELLQMVAYFRAERVRFGQSQEAKAAKPPRAKKPTAAPKSVAEVMSTFGDVMDAL